MPIGSAERRIRIIVTAATALALRQLARDLSSDPTLQVVTAGNVDEIFQQIARAQPAVILLDTQLAGENTPRLARELIHQRQIAVVLHASENERTSLLLDTLEQGALAITTKPASVCQTAEITPALIRALRSAAGASIANLLAKTEFAKTAGDASACILAMGAGAGGLLPLTAVLTQLPANAPGGVVITGLPANLTAAWCDRIAGRCASRIRHAVDGDAIRPGEILIAPGHSHLMVRSVNGGWAIAIKGGPAVLHQRPSLEVLFNSLAQSAGPSAVVALFSGAGTDGVAGLLHLKRSGGRTIVQSPQSSVCSERPSDAERCGCADLVLPANEIAQKLLDFAALVPVPCAA